MTVAIVAFLLAIYGLWHWSVVHDYAGWRWSLPLLALCIIFIGAGWREIGGASW